MSKNNNKYLIKVTDKICGEVYIDGVELEGDIEDLYSKMEDVDYVSSLGIHEDFFFLPFKLVPSENVDFPDYTM